MRMNSSEFRFTLDLHSSQSQVSLPVMEGDTARKFYISLMDGGTPFLLEDGCVAALTIKRHTGTFIQHFCMIENNTTIVYDFRSHPDTAAVNGLNRCEVSIYDAGGELISTPRFSMVVSPRVINQNDTDISDEDRHILDDIIVSEATRVASETARVAGEEARAAAEQKRQQAETERVSKEEARNTAEAERAGAEGERAASYERILTKETEIIAAENARENNETDRIFNENTRQDAEAARDSDETTRKSNESGRISNENTRVSVELVRMQNEENRVSEESKRAVAEAKRAMEWERLKEDATNSSLGAEAVDERIAAHNTSLGAHSDLRLALSELADRVNAVLNSDDATLDELNEIVAYIKSNKTLIDSITTSKVSVTDIVNDLVTNASDKPLSAAQGVALKLLINSLKASDVGALPSDTPIPYKLSEMAGDTTHRTVTDAEKTAWNAKSNFSGAYTDLTDKPTLGAAAAKGVDEGIVPGSKSKNLPTSDAVETFVVGQGYKTTDTTYTFGAGDENGQIKVTPSGGAPQNIPVKGLGSAAFASTTAFDPAGAANVVKSELGSHSGNKNNPHGVTAEQVGALPISGGTLTGELRVNGGDVAGGSKFVLETGKGQITNSGTQTLFGFTTASTIAVGHSSYIMAIRGSGARPKYNSADMALLSDIPSVPSFNTEALNFTYEDGTTRTIEVYVK
jgi:hypothetical protein